MEIYTLYLGFKEVKKFISLLKLKNFASVNDGTYNVIGSKGYRDAFTILHGDIY